MQLADGCLRTTFLSSNRPWLLALLVSVVAHWGVLLALGPNRAQGAPSAHSSQKFADVRLVSPLLVEHQVAPGSPTTSVPRSGQPDEVTEAAPLPESTEVNTLESEGESSLGAHYFSPDDLTVKPAFLRDDGAPAPTFIPDVMPLPVLVSLYINEQGGVDQVVLGESFLSDTAKRFIVDSFNAAQFSPGMLGSLAVKSVLIIEVKLDPTLPTQ
jgi:hypothetical protein